MAEFICFETTMKDQNYINKEVKGRLNLGNSYYNSVHNLVFPSYV